MPTLAWAWRPSPVKTRMLPSGYHYLPLAPLFFWGLALLFAIAVALVELGILSHAYEKMGIHRRYVFAVLFLSLLGSYVNLPVAKIRGQRGVAVQTVPFPWGYYRMPVVRESPDTVLAVNIGGAVIPTILCLYLLTKNTFYGRAALGVAVVTVVVYNLARLVPGLGVAVPTFVPPVIAAAVALALTRQAAAPLAYISGTLGTLIGADLLNLGHLSGLGAPMVSIGGAGTFDGVFLTGVIAALLA